MYLSILRVCAYCKTYRVLKVYFFSRISEYEFKRPLSLQELEALLEEDSDIEGADEIDAVYIPPPVDTLTDEEDLDDNLLLEEGIATDIAGTFEVHTRPREDIETPTESVSEPSTSKGKKTKVISQQRQKQIQYEPSWSKTESNYSSFPTEKEFLKKEEIKLNVGGKTPFEVFSLFFDDIVFNKIVNYSVKYAQDNNRHDFTFSAAQLQKFIGILILTGYHTLPACDMYWSKDLDKGLELVRKSMSRNTFRNIKRNLHVSDNTDLDKSDKFAKLRPLILLMNERYLQFGIFTHNLSIDEQMVPYFGRHSAKMFMKGKPVRFGFKIWCLCSSEGYLYQFIPYGGANPEGQKSQYTLGTQVVLDLLSVLPSPSEYRVFFDNFFSTYTLFHILNERGFFFTSTVRENRLPGCPLQSSKVLGKRNRGEFDHAFDNKAKVTVVRWNDNSVVTVATNNGTIHPVVKVKRYNRKLRKEESIPQPNMINDYNRHMGGVDLLDNSVANYRIRVRGKKWWWPLFTNLVDCTVVTSWRIYNIANESRMSQLDFRSSLVLSLLQSAKRFTAIAAEEEEDTEEGPEPELKPSTSAWGRPSKSSLPSDVRFDNVGHNIVREEEGRRRRCRLCKTNSVYMCAKCKVHLHADCFDQFHMK